MEFRLKKILIILSFLFIPVLLLGQNFHTIKTLNNEEISEVLRKKIESKSVLVIDEIKSGKIQATQRTFSKEFLKNSSSTLDSFVSNLQPIFKASNFNIADEYYTTVFKIGFGNTFTVIPEVNGERSLIINNVQIPEKESYFHFFKSNIKGNNGLEFLVFFQYVKINENWKLHILHVNNYAIGGLIAPDIMQKCIKKDNELIVSAIYCIAAQKIIKPAPFLQYPKEKEYVSSINNVFKKVNSKYNFPIPFKLDSEIKLYGVNIQITNQGISPLLNYITSKKVSEPNSIKREANKLMLKIKKTFPKLVASFEYIILQAFNEVPNNPGKKYNTFKSIFKNGKHI